MLKAHRGLQLILIHGRARLRFTAILEGGAPSLSGFAPARAVMGRLENALGGAGSGRWIDQSASVKLFFGTLVSRTEEEVFAGANLFAVESASGTFELAQFKDAALQGDGTWLLTNLLRGHAGTEAEAARRGECGRAVCFTNSRGHSN